MNLFCFFLLFSHIWYTILKHRNQSFNFWYIFQLSIGYFIIIIKSPFAIYLIFRDFRSSQTVIEVIFFFLDTIIRFFFYSIISIKKMYFSSIQSDKSVCISIFLDLHYSFRKCYRFPMRYFQHFHQTNKISQLPKIFLNEYLLNIRICVWSAHSFF
jgi:hypothetical protein